MKIKYVNRYNDIYTFTRTEDGNILMEGEWKWMRWGSPNVYDQAYLAYCTDVDTDERMTLGEFKTAIYAHDTKALLKYQKMVYTDIAKINMIDPSGGPYLHVGHNMGDFGKEFEGMIIDHFKSTSAGYLIIIEK